MIAKRILISDLCEEIEVLFLIDFFLSRFLAMGWAWWLMDTKEHAQLPLLSWEIKGSRSRCLLSLRRLLLLNYEVGCSRVSW